jgi:hypothetical protein
MNEDDLHEIRMKAGAGHMAQMDALDTESYESLEQVFDAVDAAINVLRDRDLSDKSIMLFMMGAMVAQLTDQLTTED